MPESNKEYVLVTEYFHPDTASTGQLMTDLAVGLQERGLDMTVFTGQPNYHSGDNEKQPHTSTHEGVLVNRIRAPQVRQSSLPRRLFNWTVFTVWMFFALLFSRTEKEREVVFVSNPPFLPVALWLVCRLRGWAYTYIVYDLYPDQPAELDYITEGGVIDTVWGMLNRRAFLAAKHVVALGPVMKQRISNNAGRKFDESKVEIIHNWEDEEFIEPVPKGDNWFSEEHGLVEPFSVLYSGNIGDFHDLETLVEGSTEFQDENVKFLIVGQGDNKQNIVSLAEKHGVKGETVDFLPYQPWDDLPYSLTSADVSVVAVKEGFEGVCVSSKLYTAMATGQPVLVISQPDDDEARIVEQFEAGIQVSQGDVEGIVEAINRWQSNPELVREQGKNAREAFENNFTEDQSIDEYYRMLAGTLPN
ncbi:glycosyltransferase family 4 protein [Haloarchaeobius sp. HME9146]|uniref:glycosyltransferase family 4 protein n=1 Tax=Haloarchaeobius sp. HME9146 TaxID=2978732 RepID=UPI0021BE3055|nr:glycosyltransferase family 4 protein [Haloarchaeobius sp. HME9146]MCT9098178.1 glycosyltransferase family 4 protein [Haloarchaeobius sp. HME9146]